MLNTFQFNSIQFNTPNKDAFRTQCCIISHQITWTDQNKIPLTFEDRKIVDDTRFSVVRERTSEWTLMIRDVTWEDRGEYRCTINTNPVRNKLVVLHVKGQCDDVMLFKPSRMLRNREKGHVNPVPYHSHFAL